MLALNYMH